MQPSVAETVTVSQTAAVAQPLQSVTVRQYCPADNPEIFCVVLPFDQL